MGQTYLFILFLVCICCVTTLRITRSFCPKDCNCFDRTVRCIHLNLESVPRNISNDVQLIDLRYNQLEDIPPGVFSGLSHITTIYLNDNSIRTLSEDAFVGGLINTKVIYLGSNKIEYIPVGAFQPLTNLKEM
ncbi:PREDICTED: peroxidasin-like [Rhagoletis zephyria]|uniref:peroxidasin-like n=1 Tax=Rhagoletis zephyria TaxID=28612 RepID=UPI00081163E1|nr:PREDICTED: peroxidasin-like [Rhagoletis zephyria]